MLSYIKSHFTFLIIIAALIILTGSLSQAAKARRISDDLSENILRLHVLAASDDETDQAHKLLVRDAVVNLMSPYMEAASTKEEAISLVNEHMNEIIDAANSALMSTGDENTVTVTLSREYFPEKTYGELTFPAGEYDALRICIGKADGHNWWCVMFPSLCLINASTVSVSDTGLNTLKETLNAETYSSLFTDSTDMDNEDNGIHFSFRYLKFLNSLSFPFAQGS